MKKFFKGFTLVELIIVMAILTILMAAIMHMFKPIRTTYLDATLYESQRTTQNGMIQYIGESVRYSTALGLYTKDKAPSASAAVDEFTKAYLKANGVYPAGNSEGKPADPDYSAKYSNTLEKMQRDAEIIIIDNANTYVYNGIGSKGRILRKKFIDDSGKNKKVTDSEYANEKSSDDGWRLALGAPYYGDKNYTVVFECGDSDKTISPTNPWVASDGIGIKVTSASKLGRTSTGSVVEKGAVVTTAGGVVCKNQCTPINGMFDISNFNATSATGDGTKVYIVFINEKVTIEK